MDDSDRTPRTRLRTVETGELTPREVQAIRGLLEAAFGGDEADRFTDDDWQHAIGGVHFILETGGAVAAHASVVERLLHVGGRPLRTGYVEAVATLPSRRGEGLGTRVMRAVGAHIADRFELGALGTGSHGFYARLGWLTWRGPSSVRTPAGDRPTPDEDGYIIVLPTPASPPLDLGAPISCDWRTGDAW